MQDGVTDPAATWPFGVALVDERRGDAGEGRAPHGKRFYNYYRTAEDLKNNYLGDLQSQVERKKRRARKAGSSEIGGCHEDFLALAIVWKSRRRGFHKEVS